MHCWSTAAGWRIFVVTRFQGNCPHAVKAELQCGDWLQWECSAKLPSSTCTHSAPTHGQIAAVLMLPPIPSLLPLPIPAPLFHPPRSPPAGLSDDPGFTATFHVTLQSSLCFLVKVALVSLVPYFIFATYFSRQHKTDKTLHIPCMDACMQAYSACCEITSGLGYLPFTYNLPPTLLCTSMEHFCLDLI